MTAQEWASVEPEAWLHRSALDPAVWVPVTEFDDYTCFLHAGRLLATKRWLKARTEQEVGYPLKWVRESEDMWALVPAKNGREAGS